MQRPAVVLVGNGINQCSSGVSWNALMAKLRQMPDPPIADMPHFAKPYSMLFEEVALSKGVSEGDVRESIQQLLSQQRPNALHRQLLELPVADILTTNYDYALELAADQGHSPDHGGSREKRYSLFRKHEVACNEAKRIWHLHGELAVPRSIQLGYDDYSGALEGLRSLVTKGRKETDNKSMRRRMWSWSGNQAKSDLVSWADAFFSRDVFMLGLSLDFVEISLWWLLVYRAKHFASSDRSYPVNNMITLYRREPRPHSKDDTEVLKTIRKAQADLLHAACVEVVKLSSEDWPSFYRKAINNIAERIGGTIR